METRDFYRLEEECEAGFRILGQCYHLCTSENNPVIFHNDGEFKVAMNIVALTVAIFPDIRVLTFEIMSNHFHFALSGDKERIETWSRRLVSLLKMHPQLKESKETLSALHSKLFPIESLDNIRNVIAYINRNGFIVNYNSTPFSYKWGANNYFFNSEAKSRYDESKVKATYRQKREMFHSNLADNIPGFWLIDGYVSPLCFCSIIQAEGLFRNAQHYFSKISKSVESSSSVAKAIGESLYYLDSELYSVVAMKCAKEFGCKSPSLIPSEAKVDIAKMMRFDYNASSKQISRILKMDIATVKALFPGI